MQNNSGDNKITVVITSFLEIFHIAYLPFLVSSFPYIDTYLFFNNWRWLWWWGVMVVLYHAVFQECVLSTQPTYSVKLVTKCASSVRPYIYAYIYDLFHILVSL